MSVGRNDYRCLHVCPLTYSAGSNIGNTGMSEARADERGTARHLGELRGEAIGQTFAFLQRSACMTGALRMAPEQRIGGEVRGIAGQVMQGQRAIEPRNVFLDRERFVGRQPIEDQMQGLAASTQHPAQHVHEQRAGQGARIRGEPEGLVGTDGEAALRLWRGPGTWTTGVCARAPHVVSWTASARTPDSSQKEISALVRLACRQARDTSHAASGHSPRNPADTPAARASAASGLVAPAPHHRGQAQPHAESLRDQFAHNLTRP